MTILTAGIRVVLAMAFDATGHGCDVGGALEDWHPAHLAVTRIAFHARFQMGPVIPEHPSGHNVYAYPRNCLFGLREFRQLLNVCSVLADGAVAFHAFACSRQRHPIPWVGIGMAFLTFHSQR